MQTQETQAVASQTKFRWILRWDSYQKKYRVFERAWCRGVWGQGGYAAKFTLAIRPRVIGFKGTKEEWWLSILGTHWHYRRHYGSASA